MRKVFFIVLQRNSQGRLKNENGSAGNYLPTLSPEPKKIQTVESLSPTCISLNFSVDHQRVFF